MRMHGFCDASMHAYGAVLYVRSIAEDGQINYTLLRAKSRIAPIKQQQTIPRLELLGAELLAKLARQAISICEFNNAELYLWTDSTIVLHWLGKEPSVLKTFVGNKVAKIHQATQSGVWSHVTSLDYCRFG